MKKFARVMPVLVLLAVLTLGPALTTFAQGGGANPLCAGLSDSDCKILTDAQASLKGVTSFSVPAYSISFNVTTATDKIAFDAKGSGAFAFASQTDFTVHLLIDEASATSKGQTQSGAAEIIVTGGEPAKAFVKFNGEWYGQDLTADDIESLGLGDLSGLSGMMSGQAGASGMGDLGSMGIDLTGVVTTARGDDNEVGGTKVAVFTTNLDIAKLITALVSSPMLGQAMGMGEGEGASMTPADLQMISAFVGPMLAGTTISFEQWISPDDAVIRAIKLDSVISLDLSMLSPETGKIEGEFHFMSEVSDVNQPVEVTPPTTFKPMDELEAQMEALQSSLGM